MERGSGAAADARPFWEPSLSTPQILFAPRRVASAARELRRAAAPDGTRAGRGAARGARPGDPHERLEELTAARSGRPRSVASRDLADGGEQLLGLDRLSDVHIEAGGERALAVLLARVRRDRDGRQGSPAPCALLPSHGLDQ